MAAYAAWRRRLEEDEWRFARAAGHACNVAPADRRVCLDAVERLYGCLDCGRSHRCWPLRDACICELAENGTDLVCCFSGRVVDRAAAVPGTHANDVLARDPAIPYKETTLGAALGVTDLLADGPGRALRLRANHYSDARRRRYLAQADQADAHRHAAYDVVAFERYTGGAGGSKAAAVAAALADASDGEDAGTGAAYSGALAAASRGGGGGADESSDAQDCYAEQCNHPDLWLASQRAMAENADTRCDDAHLETYLAPVAAALAPWRAAFGPAPAGNDDDTSAAVAPAAAGAPVRGKERPWHLPWAVLPVPFNAMLPHQRLLVAQYPPPVAALVDRILALVAWVQDQRAPPPERALKERARALVAHVLSARCYAHHHDALQQPVLLWCPYPAAAAAAAGEPGEAGAQKLAATLKSLPFSGRALAHVLFDALA